MSVDEKRYRQDARLTCDGCGKVEEFPCDDKNDAPREADRRGWVLNMVTNRAACPECPPSVALKVSDSCDR